MYVTDQVLLHLILGRRGGRVVEAVAFDGISSRVVTSVPGKTGRTAGICVRKCTILCVGVKGSEFYEEDITNLCPEYLFLRVLVSANVVFNMEFCYLDSTQIRVLINSLMANTNKCTSIKMYTFIYN